MENAEADAWIGVEGSSFRVQGLGFRVQGLGFGVRGFWFGVWGLEFGICASPPELTNMCKIRYKIPFILVTPGTQLWRFSQLPLFKTDLLSSYMGGGLETCAAMVLLSESLRPPITSLLASIVPARVCVCEGERERECVYL